MSTTGLSLSGAGHSNLTDSGHKPLIVCDQTTESSGELSNLPSPTSTSVYGVFTVVCGILLFMEEAKQC